MRCFLIGGDEDYEHTWWLLEQFASRLERKGRILTLMDGFENHSEWVGQFEKRLRALGFDKVETWLPGVRDSADPQEIAKAISKADTIYVFGGETARYIRHYAHPPVIQALQHAFQRGSNYVGLSTGAMVMGEFVITGDKIKFPAFLFFEHLRDYMPGRHDGTSRGTGFGVFPKIIIDSHFNERNRQARLYNALEKVPQATIAIGIDSGMGLLIEKERSVCMGEGQIYVYEKKNGEIQAHFFRHGDEWPSLFESHFRA